MLVVAFPVICSPVTPRVTPPTVRFEFNVISKLETEPLLITIPLLPGLLAVRLLPRAMLTVPKPVDVMFALPLRVMVSGEEVFAAVYETFKLVAENWVPPNERFENVVVAFNFVREPFDNSIPGAFASPSPSEMVLEENVRLALPYTVSFSGNAL